MPAVENQVNVTAGAGLGLAMPLFNAYLQIYSICLSVPQLI